MSANKTLCYEDTLDTKRNFLAAYDAWLKLGVGERSIQVGSLLDTWGMGNRDQLNETAKILRRQLATPLNPNAATPYLKDNSQDYPLLNNFEKLTGDYGVSSDWHMPLHSVRYMVLYRAICRELGIRKHIILGDLFNQETFGNYGHPPGEKFKRELRYVQGGIRWLLEDSDEIVWILGNHDDRIFRVTSGQMDPDMLLMLVTSDPRVRISRYYHCELNNTYRLTHAKAFSVQRTKVAYDLCAKFRKSVIMAHQHGIGIAPDVTGTDVAIDLGGLFDPDKAAYIKMRDAKFPNWTPGFCVIQNNAPYLFADSLRTDWKRWLGPAAQQWVRDQTEQMIRPSTEENADDH